MTLPPARRRPARKLVASPAFALMHAAGGACFVQQDSEPYSQYWLSERERLIFALCGRKGGLREGAVINAMQTLNPASEPMAEERRIKTAIAGMRAAGVLTEPDGELSRYGADMARDYLEHRPFPRALAAMINNVAGIGAESHVLDLASGPGSLALQLAETCPNVTIMELSRGFCAAAKAEAVRRGLALETINESCNRLAQHDGRFDAITISQALHWLDKAEVCKGVGRNLAPGGSFFVIDAAIGLQANHPLSYILGDCTPLGNKSPVPFGAQSEAQFSQLRHLFKGLDTTIVGAGLTLHSQTRPIGEGFARAFLSDSHIAGLDVDGAAFWQDLAARCVAARPEELMGTLEWAVLHFREGAPDLEPSSVDPALFEAIAFP